MSDTPDIKAIRERLGWSQERMAEYLGLNRSSVSRMETKGSVKGPTQKLLRALADNTSADAAEVCRAQVAA